jgi:hypothetical protein
MLLSINESKVAELLKSSGGGYVVSISDVPVMAENYLPPYPTSSESSGTVYTAPVLVTPQTKDHFMALRRQIEESGVPLRGPEELTKEIDEIRGKG